ncbi:MAG: M14 family zinc carboxypeptidase [Syntrophothermus sp.]
MKKRNLLLSLLLFAFFFPLVLKAQEIRNIYYFKFNIDQKSEISNITRLISVDNIQGKVVTAFATPEQFKKFKKLGYQVTLLPLPGDVPEDQLGNPAANKSVLTVWNYYPNYQQYLDIMYAFANDHPDICMLDTIGISVQGRLILAVKISDSVHFHQGEPQVLLTSSIHGDELAGYVCMIHLIDSLLNSYGSVDRITNMINNFELYINPMANPDGTFHNGNGSVSGAWRYNSLGIDLNRNFPDPQDGPHPDGNAWQVETKEFMRYDTLHHFVLSMNFHGGAEVYNYPWDTWAKLHPDDSWMIFTGREYVDTVHAHSPSGYMTDLNNGITNGYAWYEVAGGRQDYTTYFHHGREITLEMSSIKLPSASKLLNFWDYNKRSFLNFIEEAGYGFNGQVTDSVTGDPLSAKVNIWGHDADNSWEMTDSLTGWYFRPIDEGTWNVTFTCPGYRTKNITVDVSRRATARQNVQLVPITYGINDMVSNHLQVYPTPSSGKIYITLPETRVKAFVLKVFAMNGEKKMEKEMSSDGVLALSIDLQDFANGMYWIELSGKDFLARSNVVINH